MSDPSKSGNPPAFPAFGVTRAGQDLDAASRPAPPQTPPVDAARAAALMGGEAEPAAETVPPPGPVLLFDDDFFGGMELADALADATGVDIRTAVSDQKAMALMAEEQPSLVVVSVTSHGAPAVAAQASQVGLPLVFVTPDGEGGPAARAFPQAVVLTRGSGVAVIEAALKPIWAG